MKILTVRKVIILSGGVLLLLLVSLYTLSCYYDTKKYYRRMTEKKIKTIYGSLLCYAEEYGRYPNVLDALSAEEEFIGKQFVYDIKNTSPFWGLFIRSEKDLKKIPFLYDSHLRLNPNDDVNQIVVAEPLAIDNMRYVIYNKYINEFVKHMDEIKKNPELRMYYFKKSDDSVKRITESKFQEQVKKQGWKF